MAWQTHVRFEGRLLLLMGHIEKRRTRGGLTTTRGCLFGFVRKKTADVGGINGEKIALSVQPLFLSGGWGEYKLD